MDPAYTVMAFVAMVACPGILIWRAERAQRKRKELLALLSR